MRSDLECGLDAVGQDLADKVTHRAVAVGEFALLVLATRRFKTQRRAGRLVKPQKHAFQRQGARRAERPKDDRRQKSRETL